MDSKYSVGNNSVKGQFNMCFKRKHINSSLSEAISPKKLKQQNSKDSGIAAGNGSGSSGRFKSPPNASIIMQQRQSLPVYNVRKALMQKIRESPTLIILGETGSGKTTQIPQFLYEARQHQNKMIAITQPRRVAAITVAKRVALEQDCTLGDTVGYTVRFDDMTSENTKIKFMTDGTLLREALSDKLLKRYNIIVLDEAHERTITTDVLFGIVKEAQRIRKEKHLDLLKIIIMSATMDCDHFSKYFNNCNTVFLDGRTFSVRTMQCLHDRSDYADTCLSTIFQIHKSSNDRGDILVFLTGQEEIEALTQSVRSIAKTLEKKYLKITVFPMFAAMSQQSQMDAFNPAHHGTRKVILATNIAETSITISGIKYVIDSGRVKVRSYDPVTGIETLKIEKISQAQAWQRAGRAGRVEDGFCYRAYTKEEFSKFRKMQLPEILRCNVASAFLQLMALGILVTKFDFLDKPPDEAIQSALKELAFLGAITSPVAPALTPMGRSMSKLPLDPKYSKMLLMANDFGCLEEILTIVALLSGENIFLNSTQKREEMLTAHQKLWSKHGDHMTLLNVFNTYKIQTKARVWCFNNFFHERNLSNASSVRQQLKEICTSIGLKPTSCDNDYVQVAKCLLTGLYNNIAELQPDNSYLILANRHRARIHPSSVLTGKCRPNYILFTEFVTTGQNYLRNVSEIEPEWVAKVVPHCSFLNRINCSNNSNRLTYGTNGVK